MTTMTMTTMTTMTCLISLATGHRFITPLGYEVINIGLAVVVGIICILLGLIAGRTSSREARMCMEEANKIAEDCTAKLGQLELEVVRLNVYRTEMSAVNQRLNDELAKWRGQNVLKPTAVGLQAVAKEDGDTVAYRAGRGEYGPPDWMECTRCHTQWDSAIPAARAYSGCTCNAAVKSIPTPADPLEEPERTFQKDICTGCGRELLDCRC